MRLRLSIVLVMFAIAFFAFVPDHVSARSNPRCNGKVATQVITTSDIYYSTVEDDVIVGSSGADIIYIGEPGGIDFICGGGGNDLIYFGGEGSIADGGAGKDVIWASYGGFGKGGSGDDELHAYIATIDGGSGNDTLYVANESIADGGSGNDHLIGDHAVKLLGGSGKDFLEDLQYTQYMDCGPNADTYSTSGDPTIVRCERGEK